MKKRTCVVIIPFIMMISVFPLVDTLKIFENDLRALDTLIQDKGIFAGIKKINNDLYTGKAADNFYLVMVRMGPNNLDAWRRYAWWQFETGIRGGLNCDGFGNFFEVLKNYQDGVINQALNELWVAYISNLPVESSKNPIYGRNCDIEMFVTVITSPGALVTSHMGISRTVEGTEGVGPRVRNQSMSLHSFASKIMKMRDSKKVYMLTVPTPVMRTIMISAISKDSIFVGDNLYQKRLEKGSEVLLSKLGFEYKKGETEEQHDIRFNETAQRMYDSLVLLLKTNPPRVIITKDKESEELTIQKPNGSPLVTFNRETLIYQWLFTRAYRPIGLTLSYVLVDIDALAQWSHLIQ